MYRVRKKFKFEAAHQLRSAYSNVCTDSIHGHSYIVEVFLQAEQLDKDGMIMDFGELKDALVQVWDEWDHGLFLPREILDNMAFTDNQKKSPIVLPGNPNPTAEVMAKVLYDVIRNLIRLPESLWKVRVHETATGWAEYEEIKIPENVIFDTPLGDTENA